MLVEDYRISMVMWLMALISLGVATMPSFEQPGGDRMKALWMQGMRYTSVALQDHDCLNMVKRFEAEIG